MQYMEITILGKFKFILKNFKVSLKRFFPYYTHTCFSFPSIMNIFLVASIITKHSSPPLKINISQSKDSILRLFS